MLIRKAGGIIIQDRKLLVTRSKDEDFYIAPGGKLEKGETAEQALTRELKEELSIEVQESNLAEFGQFSAPAATQPNKTIEMTVFVVQKWAGEFQIGREIAEIGWISSKTPPGWNIGSIFEHDVLPRLKAENLID